MEHLKRFVVGLTILTIVGFICWLAYLFSVFFDRYPGYGLVTLAIPVAYGLGWGFQQISYIRV